MVMIDGNPWWVAKDVCEVLEIKDSTTATKRIPNKQKGTHEIHTLGGKQKLTIVNEAGLYKLIFTSQKPEAIKFQDWICEEVIPQIRKTGKYEAPKLHYLDAYVREFLGEYAPIFPNRFFDELFRLTGLKKNPNTGAKPMYFAKLISELVYDLLPPKVYQEVKARCPMDEGGNRKGYLHQMLSDDVGRKHLKKTIDWVTDMAELCNSIEMLQELCENRKHQLYGDGTRQLKFLKVTYEIVE